MKISFRTEKLKKICESEKKMIKNFGPVAAEKLKNRLEDLMSASNVSELIAGKPHPLKGDRSDEYAVTIFQGLRMTFNSANDPVPFDQNNKIDWRCVTEVCINFIGDYHD